MCLMKFGREWAMNDGSNFNFCQEDKSRIFIHLLVFLENDVWMKPIFGVLGDVDKEYMVC